MFVFIPPMGSDDEILQFRFIPDLESALSYSCSHTHVHGHSAYTLGLGGFHLVKKGCSWLGKV